MNRATHSPPVTQDLLPVSGAPRSARDIVTAACARWDLLPAVAPAVLIVSELVGNVVDHAHTIMTLRIARRRSGLYLSVHDGSRTPPVPRPPPVGVPERGRGLQLVEAVSSAWGYRLETGGKTVWATVDEHPSISRHHLVEVRDWARAAATGDDAMR